MRDISIAVGTVVLMFVVVLALLSAFHENGRPRGAALTIQGAYTVPVDVQVKVYDDEFNVVREARVRLPGVPVPSPYTHIRLPPNPAEGAVGFLIVKVDRVVYEPDSAVVVETSIIRKE